MSRNICSNDCFSFKARSFCGLSLRSWVFCKWQPTHQQTDVVYKSGVLECVSEARPCH